MEFVRSQKSQEAVSYYEKKEKKRMLTVGNVHSSSALHFGRRPHRHLEAAAAQESSITAR